MPTLLHIDVSPRGDYSVSRQLSAAFANEWKARNPDGRVVRRDLAEAALPYVDLPWIQGAYAAPDTHSPESKKALAVSDELIGELLEANDVVIATPMYNFAIPARLKSWIDHVVRVGKTVDRDGAQFKGLAGGRKVTVIVASGGNYAEGSPAAGYNFETPYLKAILGFIGITDVKFVMAGETNPVAQGAVPMEEYLKPHLQAVKAAV